MCKSRTSFNYYGIAQRLRPCNLHSPLSLRINAIVDDHIGVAVALVFAKLSIFPPRRRREAPCEGTNSPRLFTPGETKALAKSKVHQISRAWVTNRGWSSSLISKIWRTVMNSEHCMRLVQFKVCIITTA